MKRVSSTSVEMFGLALRGRSFRLAALLLTFFVFFAAHAVAQEATVVGTVTDPTGAALPNVSVHFTNIETGLATKVTTSADGQYVAPNLHIGHYTVDVKVSGFRPAQRTGLVLNVGDRDRVDFQMQVGQATELITVEANAVAVQTDTGEVSNLITGKQISDLAVNGTSLFQLAALAPGASNDITNYKDVPVGGDTSVSFNGQRTAHNVFMVDGGENYDRGCGGCVTTAPSSESMAEFRQLTSNYGADYGLSSAGTVTMVLKSGTSRLHGSAWENNRNDAFDARNYFFPAPNKKQELRMNIFGFNIGGPVTFGHLYNPDKNKTFFFYNMEWRRYIDGGSTNQTVPDPATYGGDFSSVTNPADIPLVPTQARVSDSVLFANCPGGAPPPGIVRGAAFPGNVIPSCMIQPNATALLGTGFLPKPNSGIGNGVGSFVGGSSTPTNLKEEIVRVDHTFNSKFSVFGHFIAEQISQGYNTAQWSGDNLPTVGDTFNNPAYSYVIHATHTISPSLLNEIAFNYNGNRINIIPFPATGMTSLALPTCTAPCDFSAARLFTGPNNLNRIPNITLNHQSNANFQISSWPWVNRADGYQIRDDVSWNKGAHSFKIGGSWARYKKVQDLFGTTQGAFTFEGADAQSFTGNSFADFLLGTAAGYGELAVQDHGNWPAVSYAAYIQDNWRATRRLTLNLGLRWDGVPHTTESNNRMGNFYPNLYDPSQAATFDTLGNICSGPADPGCAAASPGLGTSPNKILAGVPLYLNGIGTPGKNGVPQGLVNNHWAMFGPRIGFAYDLTGTGTTVIRGGFGIMYERIQGNDMYNAGPNIPFSLNVNLSNVTLANPNTLLQTGAAPTFQTIKAADIAGLDINSYKPSTSTQYSAGVQHSFGPKTVLSVSYVGNQNRHLNDYLNTNLPSLSDLALMTGGTLNYQNAPSLPFKGFRAISQSRNEANGHYNSMQVDLNSQASRDLQLRAFYTLSRSIDPTTGGSGQDLNGVTNPYLGWRYDLGPSQFDRLHNFSANFIYNIPVLRNSSNGLMKSLVGGWAVSGIITVESGLPVNFTGGSNLVCGFNCPTGSNRPNVNGSIKYEHTPVASTDPFQRIQYVDTSVFSTPAPGTWGNLGHNAIRGPGRDNWNLSLFKTFAITESAGLQLKLETFNTFNHTQFQTVDNGLGDSRFGQFTAAYPARIVQLAGKVYF